VKLRAAGPYVPGILPVRRGISPLPLLIGHIEYASTLTVNERAARRAAETFWERHHGESGETSGSIAHAGTAFFFFFLSAHARSGEILVSDAYAENELWRLQPKMGRLGSGRPQAMPRSPPHGFLGVTFAVPSSARRRDSDFFHFILGPDRRRAGALEIRRSPIYVAPENLCV